MAYTGLRLDSDVKTEYQKKEGLTSTGFRTLIGSLKPFSAFDDYYSFYGYYKLESFHYAPLTIKYSYIQTLKH